MKVLEIKNLYKTYYSRKSKKSDSNDVHVLRNLNLTIEEGGVYGLLGLNGAGKTTLIRIITGILTQDKGDVKVFGKNITHNEKEIKSKLGVVIGGDRSLYWKLTGRENLEFFGTLYNMQPNKLKSNIQKYLKYVGLETKQDDLVETYSKGMKQRLLIAKALITEPKFLVLDEPTVGLDIQVAKDFRNLLMDLNKNHSLTILITTHYLYEAEQICSRIGLLKNGKIIAQGSINELKRMSKYNGTVQFITEQEITQKNVDELSKIGEVFKINSSDDQFKIYKMYTNDKYKIKDIIHLLYDEEISFKSIEEKSLSLEDIVAAFLD